MPQNIDSILLIKSLEQGMHLVCNILAVDDEECQQSYNAIKPHYTLQENLHSITLTKDDGLRLTLYNKPHQALPDWQLAIFELEDEESIDHSFLNEQLKLQFLEKRLDAIGVGRGEVCISYVYQWLLNRKIKLLLKTKYLHTSETDLWGIYQIVVQKEQA